jgi:hypothetical protein
MNDVDQSIYNRLSSNSSLTALVNGHMYAEECPFENTSPVIAWHADPQEDTSLCVRTTEYEVVVTTESVSKSQAKALADMVVATMAGRWSDGVCSLSIKPTSICINDPDGIVWQYETTFTLFG